MAAWHKRRDPEPTIKPAMVVREPLDATDQDFDGYLLFPSVDGGFDLWLRQQPPIPGVTLVPEVREPGPQYKAEWTLFPKEEREHG